MKVSRDINLCSHHNWIICLLYMSVKGVRIISGFWGC